MRTLSDEDATDWCAQQKLSVTGGFPGLVCFSDGVECRIRIKVPEDSIATVGLAYLLIMTGVSDYEEGNLPQSLIWYRRWEVWSETIDRAGYPLLNGLRSIFGHLEPISVSPGMLFARGDIEHAQACLILPLLFQWDSFYVPEGGHLAIQISHHGHVDIVVRAADKGAIHERFKDWSPEDL